MKFLIGIAPQGVISFISDSCCGQSGDKYVIEHCGILNELLPGDIVLAGRGFEISDMVAAQQLADLHISAFARGTKQLSALDVEQSRSIANVRMHVERKFSIFQGVLPIDFLIKRSERDCPLNIFALVYYIQKRDLG